MAVKDDLARVEEGFWLGGEDHFLSHVDDQCMLVFAEMRGLYSRAQVAASARDPKRWTDLRIAEISLHQPRDDTACLSYEARVKRGDGKPYRALIGSIYVQRDDGWKLVFHQHSTLDPDEGAGTA